MAKLQVNAKISVRHNKLNKRYTAEIIDYRKWQVPDNRSRQF